MLLNKQVSVKVLCAVSVVIGVSMLLPCLVSVLYGEKDAALSFAFCAVPMVLLGGLCFRLSPAPKNANLGLRDGFFIVGSAWIVMTLLGALPFVLSGCIPDFADAVFETASGFSTSGGSILSDVEALPKGMLFWRSFTHWLGGMGVLVLTIAILPALGIGGQKIMRAETTGPSMDKITFTFNDSARSLYLIYTGMTLLETVLLLFGGMDLFDALVYSFGTVGTGGFATYAEGCAHFGSFAQIVLAVFMMLSGINFNLYYLALNKKSRTALSDTEMHSYLAIIGGSTLFIMIQLLRSGLAKGLFDSFRLAYFQVCSIITTTGYGTCDYDLWPLPSRFVLFFLMFIGGCASSTGGGIKVIRAMMACKIGARELRRRLHPDALEPIRVGGRIVAEDTVKGVCDFLILYMLTLVASTLLISLEGVSLITAFSTALACFSNIGPGFEAVGPTLNFGFYSAPIKLFLSLLMLAGRLELYTVFLLFTPAFWSKN